MIEIISYCVSVHCGRFANEQILITAYVGAGAQYGVIGLVFVDGAQVYAQHPDGGVEPLQGGYKIGYKYVYRMVECHVGFLMVDDGGFTVVPIGL